jgi:hypothetical protein
VTAGPISSIGRLEPVLTIMVVSSASAARAVASSASGWANRWSAVGANRIGRAIVRPSTVVDVSMWLTSTSARGRNAHRVYASRFARAAPPLPAQPATKL